MAEMFSEKEVELLKKKFELMDGEINDDEFFLALARERLRLRKSKKSCENNPVSKNICVKKETPLPQQVTGKVLARTVLAYKRGVYIGKIGIALLTTPNDQKFVIFKEVKGYTQLSTLKRLSLWSYNSQQPLKLHRNCLNFYIREADEIWWRLNFRSETDIKPLLKIIDGLQVRLLKKPPNVGINAAETKLISKITNPSVEDPRLKRLAAKAAKKLEAEKEKETEINITNIVKRTFGKKNELIIKTVEIKTESDEELLLEQQENLNEAEVKVEEFIAPMPNNLKRQDRNKRRANMTIERNENAEDFVTSTSADVDITEGLMCERSKIKNKKELKNKKKKNRHKPIKNGINYCEFENDNNEAESKEKEKPITKDDDEDVKPNIDQTVINYRDLRSMYSVAEDMYYEHINLKERVTKLELENRKLTEALGYKRNIENLQQLWIVMQHYEQDFYNLGLTDTQGVLRVLDCLTQKALGLQNSLLRSEERSSQLCVMLNRLRANLRNLEAERHMALVRAQELKQYGEKLELDILEKNTDIVALKNQLYDAEQTQRSQLQKQHIQKRLVQSMMQNLSEKILEKLENVERIKKNSIFNTIKLIIKNETRAALRK